MRKWDACPCRRCRTIPTVLGQAKLIGHDRGPHLAYTTALDESSVTVVVNVEVDIGLAKHSANDRALHPVSTSASRDR